MDEYGHHGAKAVVLEEGDVGRGPGCGHWQLWSEAARKMVAETGCGQEAAVCVCMYVWGHWVPKCQCIGWVLGGFSTELSVLSAGVCTKGGAEGVVRP